MLYFIAALKYKALQQLRICRLRMLLYELDQNRTDIYFRDKEVLYLFKLLILGDKRFELLKATAIEFTAQPFLPIKEPSFI